jgi:hypothetical protein
MHAPAVGGTWATRAATGADSISVVQSILLVEDFPAVVLARRKGVGISISSLARTFALIGGIVMLPGAAAQGYAQCRLAVRNLVAQAERRNAALVVAGGIRRRNRVPKRPTGRRPCSSPT